jgi:hypothetical protein
MGRSAGWLAYGAAIAGEASLAISVEDIIGTYRVTETVTDEHGKTETNEVMDVDRVVNRIVKTMTARDSEGKHFGVIVLAEGLAELLPAKYLKGIPRDDHGHISISHVNLGRMFAKLVSDTYKQQTGKSRKVTGLQLGYESRCTRPQAFDVMLGSQLGVGAYRALVEEGHNGVMVSVSGQLQLHYVPFERLIDPTTLVTVVRYIEPTSDFHRLARFLETHVNDSALRRERSLVLGTPVMRGSGSTAIRSAGRRIEDRFAHVVAVAAVVDKNVQVAEGVGGEGLPEVLDQLAVELADLGAGELGVKHEVVATGEVDRRRRQRLLHGQCEVAVAADAFLIAEGLLHRLAQADAHVFHCVVLIDLKVAFRFDGQIEGPVPREQLEHVVEEPHARFPRALPAAVQV